MKRLLLPFLLLGSFVIASCNEETDRYEYIKKLRSLGVATNPVAIAPSTTASPQVMTLTFYASVPLGHTVTSEPFVDDQARYSVPLVLTLVPGSEAYEEHNSFRLYSVQATTPIPTADVVRILPDPGFARARYALKIADGGEEEKIVGNFLIYPEGSAELAWTAPAIDITTPAAGAIVSGDQDLKAALTNPIGENMRLGWFVPDGALKSRRAKETEWETPDAGPSTLVVTARGMKSGAFALKILDVTVQ